MACFQHQLTIDIKYLNIGLINIGSSWWQYEHGIPIGMIPAKTDIRLEQSAATDAMDSVGGFDMLLVDD